MANGQVNIYPDKTIVFLVGKEGRERFDAIEQPSVATPWRPIMRPNAHENKKGHTHCRYIKKVVYLGGLPISFEVRETE